MIWSVSHPFLTDAQLRAIRLAHRRSRPMDPALRDRLDNELARLQAEREANPALFPPHRHRTLASLVPRDDRLRQLVSMRRMARIGRLQSQVRAAQTGLAEAA
jgi:hypothetical protein